MYSNTIIRHLVGPSTLIFLWWLIAYVEIFNPLLLPGPWATFEAIVTLLGGTTLFADIGATLGRVLMGLLISILVGIPLGLILGSSRKIYESLELIIDFFRSMPATAIFPVFLLLFGVADSSKIAVAVFGSVLVIIFNTAHGVLNASSLRMLMAKTLHASRWKIFKSILFWESLPQTFIGVRTALNFCLIIIVVTEMFIGTTVGLGRRIIDFQIIYETPAMYAVIVVVGIMGYALNLFVARLQARVVHWTK